MDSWMIVRSTVHTEKGKVGQERRGMTGEKEKIAFSTQKAEMVSTGYWSGMEWGSSFKRVTMPKLT